MSTAVLHGIDIAGTTAHRAAINNAPLGFVFYDTDTAQAYVMGNTGWEAIVNGGTITGGATVDSITGGDSSLGITGIAGSSGAGGIVAIAGGVGDSGAGGAASVTGGAGNG